MSEGYQCVVLRLDAKTLPAVRAALDASLDELASQLRKLREAGFIRQPWLGDRVSEQVQVHYNSHVMESFDGPYAAVAAYEAELAKIRDTVDQMEREYVQLEDRIATDVNRI